MSIAAVLLALTIGAPTLLPAPAPAPLSSKPGCNQLSHGDVVSVPHGFYVAHLDAFFAFEDAIPSGDDWFWLCVAPEGPLALYVPIEPPMEDEEEGEQ